MPIWHQSPKLTPRYFLETPRLFGYPKMLSKPNLSYKPFWGICRPLISWRANSPNPIQIYCVRLRIRAHLCCTVVKNKNNFSIQRKDLGTLNSYPLLLKPLLFQDYPIY